MKKILFYILLSSFPILISAQNELKLVYTMKTMMKEDKTEMPTHPKDGFFYYVKNDLVKTMVVMGGMVMEENFDDLKPKPIGTTPDSSSLKPNPEPETPTLVKSTFTKTGNSKKILGYNCDEYILVGRSGESSQQVVQSMYITNEIKLDEKITNSKLFSKNIMQKELAPQGIILEVNMGDELTSSIFQITSIEFKVDDASMNILKEKTNFKKN